MIILKRFLEFKKLTEEAEIDAPEIDAPEIDTDSDDFSSNDEDFEGDTDSSEEEVKGDIGDDPDADPDVEEEESDEGRFDRQENPAYLAELTFMEIEKKLRIYFDSGKFSHSLISEPHIETKIYGGQANPQITVNFDIGKKLQFQWTISVSLEDISKDQQLNSLGIQINCYDFEKQEKIAIFRKELNTEDFSEKFFIKGMNTIKKQINAYAKNDDKGIDLFDEVF